MWHFYDTQQGIALGIDFIGSILLNSWGIQLLMYIIYKGIYIIDMCINHLLSWWLYTMLGLDK